MPLPLIGTQEWEEEVNFYRNAGSEELWERAEKYEMQLVSYQRRMRERGILKEQAFDALDTLDVTVNLPEIKLIKYKAPKKRGDEEEAILHCSDGHAGKITTSFDKDVYVARMETMFRSAMTIVKLHRNMYPVRKLHIILTGDMVQGENIAQGSKVGEVEMGARDQVKKLACPTWNNVIASFKQEFEEVDVHGLPGNHGKEKLAPETSNYDLLLYDILEKGIGNEGGINVFSHEDWAKIIEIFGFKIFAFHGDGVPCQQGVPFFALDKKLKSWYMQYGGFSYAMGGHFHKRHTDEISSKLEYFMSGSLVSDDAWALKRLGISSNPSQWIYGIHPKHGITWRYPLVVDYKFLPEDG